MTIGGSIALIVIGAILKFAVTWSPAHIDIQLIGVILMIAGIAGLVIALGFMMARRRSATAPTTEVYEERRYREPPL